MDELNLSKPRRFWFAAAATAGLSMALAGPFLDQHPWLISVPIALGSIFVVAAEFWESLTSGLGQPTGEDDHPTRPVLGV